MKRRTAILGLVIVLQFVLVGWAVAPRLSARLTGEQYFLRVGPVDPIDPFRGAYVDLSYPDLVSSRDGMPRRGPGGEAGDLYIPLKLQGEVLVPAGPSVRERPDDGLFIACNDEEWRLRCGIESLFLPQEEAARIQREISESTWFGRGRDRESGYVARVKIDDRGNAALLGIEQR